MLEGNKRQRLRKVIVEVATVVVLSSSAEDKELLGKMADIGH